MKYLKKFENDANIARFKLGDIIYCINNDYRQETLKKNEPYVVVDFRGTKSSNPSFKTYVYDIINKEETLIRGLNEERFISELEYNANKYNIG